MITPKFLLCFVVCFNQLLQATSQECQVITTTTTKNCGEHNAVSSLPTSQIARGKKGPKGERGLPGQAGEKGNPGIDCNVTQISELQQKVAKLEQNNLIMMKLMPFASIGNCFYKFTDQGDFSQARSECRSYGGDLIHRNFGPSGAAYHEEIRAFITSKMDLSRHGIWIGYTDVDREGQWTLVNGELYDAGDRSQESLYYWMSGQPDNANGNEDCAHIWFQASLNDIPCSTAAHSSWKFYGLCEICQA